MNEQVQRWRELKHAFVWLFLPALTTIIIVKIILTWLTIGQMDTVTALTMVVCFVITVGCWLWAKRIYAKWLADVFQGSTQSGKTLYHLEEKASYRSVLLQIGLLAILAFIFDVFHIYEILQTTLAFLCGGLIWSLALDTIIAVNRCILGERGLWVTYVGVKLHISYSSISKAFLEKKDYSDKFIVTLARGDSVFRRFQLPMLLPDEAVRLLEKFVVVETSR